MKVVLLVAYLLAGGQSGMDGGAFDSVEACNEAMAQFEATVIEHNATHANTNEAIAEYAAACVVSQKAPVGRTI